jgi:N-acetylneuraminic acid mutarotase
VPIAARGPEAREDHTWTAAADGAVAYLFGGRDGARVFDDLWTYTFASDTWLRLEAEGGPAARFGHDAAWVDGIGLVIFAGQSGSTFYNDLWAFDPATMTWRQLPAAGDVPVARYGSCAALGPDGRLWISHGFTADGVRFDDTRTYDFTAEAWSDATPATERPIVRCLHRCWWAGDDLVLFAGQTTGVAALGDAWRLADGTWVETTGTLPSARNLAAAADLGDATLIFGGQAASGSFLGDAWVMLDGGAAIELHPAAAPTGRAGAELVLDRHGSRLLLFGGRGEERALDDVWSLDVGSLPTRP